MMPPGRGRAWCNALVRKTDVIALLLSHADDLRAAGVAHVSLFGAVAGDGAGPDSDVGLVVGGPPERPMTLFGMARAEAALERLLGRPVDLTSQQGVERAADLRWRIADDLTRSSRAWRRSGRPWRSSRRRGFAACDAWHAKPRPALSSLFREPLPKMAPGLIWSA